jgi:hypothetical protein
MAFGPGYLWPGGARVVGNVSLDLLVDVSFGRLPPPLFQSLCESVKANVTEFGVMASKMTFVPIELRRREDKYSLVK